MIWNLSKHRMRTFTLSEFEWHLLWYNTADISYVVLKLYQNLACEIFYGQLQNQHGNLNLLAVKRWHKSQKRIYLSNKIYNTWQMLKYQGPYKSDSDFDVYLISLEIRRRKKGKYGPYLLP